jgi:hypothetical protein
VSDIRSRGIALAKRWPFQTEGVIAMLEDCGGDEALAETYLRANVAGFSCSPTMIRRALESAAAKRGEP